MNLLTISWHFIIFYEVFLTYYEKLHDLTCHEHVHDTKIHEQVLENKIRGSIFCFRKKNEFQKVAGQKFTHVSIRITVAQLVYGRIQI